MLYSFAPGLNTLWSDPEAKEVHFLETLDQFTGQGKFIWKLIHQKAFDEMKAIIVADAIIAFPDYYIPLHVYTDASDLNLGAAIIQRDKPIVYYIKNITPDQQKLYNNREGTVSLCTNVQRVQ